MSLVQIEHIIKKSLLHREVKKDSINVFRLLYEAERRAHKARHPGLHELGENDTIADIVGVCWALRHMGISRCYASAVNLGHGTVQFSGGHLPVPSPAALEILKGLPVYSSGPRAELTTPTGAALLKYWAEDYSPLPLFLTEQIGYGAGDRTFKGFPNVLRILLGKVSVPYETDTVFMLQSNIDDLNPQIYEYLTKRLFESGALDVWLTPIQMKAGRPGIKLSLLCDRFHLEKLGDIIFQETTTLGIRVSRTDRIKLKRKEKTVRFSWGRVKIKTAGGNKIVPEYRDCEKIARKRGIPLKEVIEKVKQSCK